MPVPENPAATLLGLSAEQGERDNSNLVEAVLAEHMAREPALVEGGGRVRRLHLSGTDPRYGRYRNFVMAHGRFFDRADFASGMAVAVLGFDAAEELFGSAGAALHRTIRIDGRPFTVCGVADRKGRQYTDIRRPDDRLVLVPSTAAELRLGFPEASVSRLLVFPQRGVPGGRAVGAVLASLGPRAGFHPDDADAIRVFDISEFLDLLEWFHLGFSVFIGIAGVITLVVAAVSIANHQFATMTERRVELAVRRVLGAQRRVLVSQVVLESLVVAGAAALVGAVAGFGLSEVIGALTPVRPVFAPHVVALVGGCLVAVAVVSVVGPARHATRIEPSSALWED